MISSPPPLYWVCMLVIPRLVRHLCSSYHDLNLYPTMTMRRTRGPMLLSDWSGHIIFSTCVSRSTILSYNTRHSVRCAWLPSMDHHTVALAITNIIGKEDGTEAIIISQHLIHGLFRFVRWIRALIRWHKLPRKRPRGVIGQLGRCVMRMTKSQAKS